MAARRLRGLGSAAWLRFFRNEAEVSCGRALQVARRLPKQHRRIAHLADGLIASRAEQAADAAGRMAVIESKPGLPVVLGRAADRASPALHSEKLFIRPGRDAVIGGNPPIPRDLGGGPISLPVLFAVGARHVLGLVRLHARFAGVMPAIVGVTVARKGFVFPGFAAVDADLHTLWRPAKLIGLWFSSHRRKLLGDSAGLAGAVTTIRSRLGSMKFVKRLRDAAYTAGLFVHHPLTNRAAIGIA